MKQKKYIQKIKWALKRARIYINLLSNMTAITKNTLIIDSLTGLEAEMCRYNCHTKEELEEVLWNDYDTTLVLTYEREEA